MFNKIVKALFLVLVIFLSYKIYNKENFYLLQNANLIFHEAGHTLFMFFGQFLYVLGGSIGQLFFPVVFLVYFLSRLDYFSSSIMFWWFGENINEISIYMADARVQQLELLGGDKSGHDWTYLFSRLNLLQLDTVIGNFFWWLGIVVMTIAFATAIYAIVRK